MSPFSEEYPLHKAAASGDNDRVRELLVSGIKVNARTRSSETPLMAAVRSAKLDVVQTIIAASANLDARDKASRVAEGRQTALHLAVRFGYLRIAAALLEAGVQVDPVSQTGHTPLVHACYNSNLEVVCLLLDRGANPNGLNSRYATPLTAAATVSTVALAEKRQNQLETSLEIAGELLRRGADPNKVGGAETPLHATASVAFAQKLLTAGAHIEARNAKGETPLIVWAMAGSLELLSCYVKAGADVNAKSDSGDEETALKRIFDRRPPEIEAFELLVSAGGDIFAIDRGGRSLLDYYLWRLDRIKRARASDELREKYYTDDYLDERTKLVEFLSARTVGR